MSMKNNYLLQRSGRDQFGNKGDANSIRPPKGNSKDNLHTEQHKKLNEDFLGKFSARWLKMFNGLTRKDIHKKLFPHGSPALSTFRKHSRDFEVFEDYMLFLLLKDKRKCLSLIDVKKEEIETEISKFDGCGRYGVTYKGHGIILTY